MVPHRRFISHNRTVKVLAKGEENGMDCAMKQRHGSRVGIGVAACAVPEHQQQTTGVTLPDEREEQKSSVHSQISVKICGVAYPEDATWAARCGADFVGMILWPKSKRSISRQQAVDVANAAKEHGAVPVGVFVEEGVEEIVNSCTSAGIAVAQLHGDGAMRALGDLPDWLQVVYVLNADKHGTLQPASLLGLTGSLTPEEGGGHGVLVNRRADWVLIDVVCLEEAV
ncbi:hypothetical protein CBR_g37169 [Chara braunii]|uniref:phosphoribosylanthranilate isomerase n=1 Tax=Chara braunii TaxID=69332 RepID=A0A388LMC7_CHABU|nr:hypothetical protein CBR_g37169 [Chara braunii]|eukprot:GBG83457.1 hypothetical protein CBR_g37169 [Chara braunii]